MKSHRQVTSIIRSLLHVAGHLVTKYAEERKLCIINYHQILECHDPLLGAEPDIDTFRWHLELLSECFHVLPLMEAIEALETNSLPPRSVCITFDDGYRSIHDLALPILKEFKLPATVFVNTGFEANENMWNDRILEAIRQHPGNELNLQEWGLGIYSLKTEHQRRQSLLHLTESTKYLLPNERLDFIRHLECIAGNVARQNLMLTSDMISNLAKQGIEIGGHTITHPILTKIDDDTARYEIEENKRQLEAIIGKPVSLFAYPNGKEHIDFEARHIAMVKEAGYKAAFTTSAGSASSKQDRYCLPRCRPWDNTPLMFGARLLYWLAGKGN